MALVALVPEQGYSSGSVAPAYYPGVQHNESNTSYVPSSHQAGAFSTNEIAKDLIHAVTSGAVGSPKSNNTGKTVQQASQSLSGSSEPAVSPINVGTSEQDFLQQLIDISQSNTAKEQEFAREQMAWQEAQNAKAMEFNASQAQINRDWQEMMSNTAHQREVADMIAAGINPVLSVTGGNGATVTSGATASGVTSAGSKGSVDTGVTSALANMFASLINAQSMENVAKISANSAQAVAGINAGSAMAVQESRNAQERYIYQNYPSNIYSYTNSLFNPLNENSLPSILTKAGSGSLSDKSASRSGSLAGISRK